jgi:hypothetical protein
MSQAPERPKAAVRIASLLMAVLFLLSAALQYNDPDPLIWIALYVSAALASLTSSRSPARAWPPALVGGISLVWAVAIGIRLEPGSPGRMFDEFGMESVAIEEAREATGLLIVAAWMVFLLLYARFRSRR